jgi:predicted hydrocarbon binding protein
MLPSGGRDMVALPLATVRSLVAGGGSADDAVHALRSAGHAGGAELARSFAEWVQSKDRKPAAELPLETFNERVAEFFALAGWGQLRMSSLHDVAAAVDVEDNWEPRSAGSSAGPRCHITTGALAAFFSTYAPYALAAIEVECAAAGAHRCRFLLGPAPVLEELYERTAATGDYESALAQISGATTAA